MTDQPITPGTARQPSYADAIFPIVTLIVLIAASVYLFGLNALDGPSYKSVLVICSMVTGLVIIRNGHTWEEIAEAGRRGLSSIVSAIFILLAVGALIGTWNMSGTIPTLVYYGIQWINPNWYYLTTALICAAVSLSIGSSWTTAGTIGVGLVGIASLVGVSPVITAGAVISGSYLGDKNSPLSETTVLAAQLVDADLYTHIRAQVSDFGAGVPHRTRRLRAARPVSRRHWPAPGADLGRAVSARSVVLDHPAEPHPAHRPARDVPEEVSPRRSPSSSRPCSPVSSAHSCTCRPCSVSWAIRISASPVAAVKAIWLAMATGYQENSGLKDVDALLSRGGMDSMLKTIWLIIAAVNFGALLEEFGLLAKLIDPIMARARTTGRLFATTAGTALGLNIVAADQYIALVLPARMFRLEFERRGLAPQTLSRACADAGTVTSPLVPWNSCGAYMSAVLGIPTLLYLPFCIFNIMSPILTVLYGFTGFKIQHLPPADAQVERSSAA